MRQQRPLAWFWNGMNRWKIGRITGGGNGMARWWIAIRALPRPGRSFKLAKHGLPKRSTIWRQRNCCRLIFFMRIRRLIGAQALYEAGRCFEQLNENDQAKIQYAQCVKKFKGDEMVAALARGRRLEALGGIVM